MHIPQCVRGERFVPAFARDDVDGDVLAHDGSCIECRRQDPGTVPACLGHPSKSRLRDRVHWKIAHRRCVDGPPLGLLLRLRGPSGLLSPENNGGNTREIWAGDTYEGEYVDTLLTRKAVEWLQQKR